MKNVYLSILHLTVKFHCKKTVTLVLAFCPASPSPTLSLASFVGFAGITAVSRSVSVFVHLVFSKTKIFFF
jgi:hypothetical protein